MEPDRITEFRLSRGREFSRLLVVFVVVWLVLDPLLLWLLGDRDGYWSGPWWGRPVQGVLTAAFAAALITFLMPNRPETWVRTSSGGLELVAAGSDPIRLGWPDIAGATVRRAGLRQLLEVTPVDAGPVAGVRNRRGRRLVRDGVLTADVTLLAHGPRALNRELARWSP